MRVFGIFERIPELKQLINEQVNSLTRIKGWKSGKLAQRRLEKISMRAV